jgi:hypothetical protein
LEVNVIVSPDVENFRDKVVFGGWVSLDDVSSLSFNVEVEDSGKTRNSSRSRSDAEDVGSVLEGSGELSGIGSQRNISGSLSGISIVALQGNVRVLLQWSTGSVLGRIGKSESINVSSGNVVSQSEYTSTIVLGNAILVLSNGKSPVVVRLVSTEGASEVIISAPWYWQAFRSRDIPSWGSVPLKTSSSTVVLIVGHWLSILEFVVGVRAVSLANNVLALRLVPRAKVGSVG